ncbi:MAG: hypothetical protein RIS73_774, partial [Bacteroidota bacterium]
MKTKKEIKNIFGLCALLVLLIASCKDKPDTSGGGGVVPPTPAPVFD